MMPLSQWTSPSTTAAAPVPEDVTGSIARPQPAPAVVGADADVIRRTVEKTSVVAPTTQVAWTNPETGNSGTISDLVPSRAANGAPCRDFRTTVATIGGVRLFAGRACQGYVGPWDLVRLEPTDAATAG
jgi:surface antigen